jgi:hypothetical protein
MPEWGKSKRQPRGTQPPRDPRVDSVPPSSLEEAPLRRHTPQKVAQHVPRTPSLRPMSDASAARIVALETEVSRLREQHASDADQLGQMLVRLAEMERATAAALARAAESDGHAETLSVELGREKARMAKLEMERLEVSDAALAGLRSQLEEVGAAQAQLKKDLTLARECMATAMTLLEDLERREEMVAGVRRRAIDQMKKCLSGSADLPPPAARRPPSKAPLETLPMRSAAPMKPLKERMAEPEPFLELDLSD